MTTPIDVNDLTFGCELETVIPAGTIPVGAYHNGRQVAALPPGWTVERDCSINCPAGHEAAEFVSPILKGADGLKQVKQVCDWLNAVGAKVNKSTGFHVHIGWAGDAEALKRLTHYVANFEKALFASSGTRSREEGSFCRPIREADSYTSRFRDAANAANLGLPSNRYHLLNLTNLETYRKQTVEFRVFSGTTNATKALGYIRLCLGIVEKALRTARQPKWIGKTPVETSPFHRKGGEGQTELTRLFYALGWTKGDSKHIFGNIQPEGLPTIEDAKVEIMRLGKKYDTRAEIADNQAPATTSGEWDAATWTAWENQLRPGTAVNVVVQGDRVLEPTTFVRRYPRSLQIRFADGSLHLLPRFHNAHRYDGLRVFPIS
jgi:hypothetical protein